MRICTQPSVTHKPPSPRVREKMRVRKKAGGAWVKIDIVHLFETKLVHEIDAGTNKRENLRSLSCFLSIPHHKKWSRIHYPPTEVKGEICAYELTLGGDGRTQYVWRKVTLDLMCTRSKMSYVARGGPVGPNNPPPPCAIWGLEQSWSTRIIKLTNWNVI